MNDALDTLVDVSLSVLLAISCLVSVFGVGVLAGVVIALIFRFFI